MGETAVDGGADKVGQGRPVAAGIQHHDRLGMNAKLLPGDDFKRLVQRSQAARQHHEAVGQFEHAGFALMHGLRHDLLGHGIVADFQVLEKFRNDADDTAAAGQYGIGDDPHQADAPAAVNQGDAARRHQFPQPLRGRPVGRVLAGLGAAKDTQGRDFRHGDRFNFSRDCEINSCPRCLYSSMAINKARPGQRD